MEYSQRPYYRPLLWSLLIIAAVLLSACGGRVSNDSYAGMSSDGQKVYLAYGPGVLAYDPETGGESWIYPAEPDSSLLFFSAPDNIDERVTFGDYGKSGGFLSPRITVNIYEVEDVESGTPPTNWINDQSATDKIVAPTLQVGDQVFVGTADNFIISLDRRNGSEQWRYETEHAIWGRPSYEDGILYVSSMDWSMYALNADTGELLWTTPLGGALPTGPILGDDLLYVSSFDSSVYALEMKTGKVKWQAHAADVVWGAPALADGVLYFTDIDGLIHAIDAQTADPVWSIESDGVLQASPVVVGDLVYIAAEKPTDDGSVGTLSAYKVQNGERVWQQNTIAPLFTTPVVVGDDTIVVALQDADSLLVGYDLETGAERWRYAVEVPS